MIEQVIRIYNKFKKECPKSKEISNSVLDGENIVVKSSPGSNCVGCPKDGSCLYQKIQGMA